jgi:hypothetical protein
MRYFGSVKDGFQVKVSVGWMSRDLGCLVRGRSLAQARDWRVRSSSGWAGWFVSRVLFQMERRGEWGDAELT